MMDLSKSYMMSFDPQNIAPEGDTYGFLYVNIYGPNISGPKRWHLVQIMPDAGTDGNNERIVRFIELLRLSTASAYELCTWIPLQWPDPDMPKHHLPACRLTLDYPGGERITRTWGPGPMSKRGKEIINRMLDLATGGQLDG